MTVILCGQDDVFLSTCPGCEASYHRIIPGGVVGPHGWRYCEQACIDSQLDYEELLRNRAHLQARDLLCDCAVCTAAGHPTAAEILEAAEYHASAEAQP